MKTPHKNELKKRSNWFEYILIIPAISFAVLAFFAKQYQYFPFDLVVTKSIQMISWPIFAQIMLFMSELGYVLPGGLLLAVGVGSLLILKKQLDAMMLFFSTSGAVVISLIFKLLVSRPRPDPLLINQSASYQVPDSFPSGHVLFFVGFVGYFLYLAHLYLPKTAVRSGVISICLGLIFLMGVSRIYLGAHWFSDTLGAYLIGTVWLMLVVWIRHHLIDFPAKKSQN